MEGYHSAIVATFTAGISIDQRTGVSVDNLQVPDNFVVDRFARPEPILDPRGSILLSLPWNRSILDHLRDMTPTREDSTGTADKCLPATILGLQ